MSYPDQALSGTPEGLALEAPAHYSFGAAAAPDGSVWFTEFNHQQLRRFVPATGAVEVKRTGLPGMYGLALDRAGTVFLGQDLGDQGNPGKVLRLDAKTGELRTIIAGITRPRQLVCDPQGNLFVVCETGTLLRWSATDNTVQTVLSGLSTPQGVAVAADGTLYWSEYGRAGSVAGRVLQRRPDGTVKTLATGFWRARGLALTPQGALYLTTEANFYDHGSSGLLVRLDTKTGKVTHALQGLDYPQFPCATPEGRVFFACNRDSWLVSFGPTPPTPKAPALRLTVDSLVIERRAGLPAQGWVRIPAEKLSLNRHELYTDRGDPEHPQPGIFALPTVRLSTPRGRGDSAVIALRGHGGQRFPMTHPGTAQEAPPAGFNESPIAYLVFYRWKDSLPWPPP